jgi:site-specific recombinase XerD
LTATQDYGSEFAAFLRGMRLKRRSPETIRFHLYSWRCMSAWLGTDAVNATRADIEAFLEQRMSEVAAATVRHHRVSLGVIFKWLTEEGYVDRNPCLRVPLIEAESAVRRVMDDSEIAALLKTCRGTSFRDRRDYAIIRCLASVGSPRVGEMVSMTVTSVNLRSDIITVSGKTGLRDVPLTDKTAVALEKYLKARSAHRLAHLDALWIGGKGAIGARAFGQMLVRRTTEAGIPHVFPHLFRHWATARASEAGMPDSLLEAAMGWTPGGMARLPYGRATLAQRAQQAARNLALGDRF